MLSHLLFSPHHLIILGKYFLNVNDLNTIMYKFDDFVSLVRKRINVEKYIAVTCNEEKDFRNKWKFYSVFIKLYCVLFSFQLLYFDLFLFAILFI